MTLNARWLLAALATVLLAQTLPAHAQSPTPLDPVRDRGFIEEIQAQFGHPAVRLTLEARRDEAGQLNETEILELDGQWRAERESDDQPLITAVLAAPLSNYLLQIQAGSLGLYSEIFVMDVNGLNAGQSAITSDYWQGDEAKFQKTYDVAPDAVFIDEPEFNDATGTWRQQLNFTLTSPAGDAYGAATVEINLTEFNRRRLVGLI